jgi:HD-GYP domain-containing protein (c-di-GMP phosphodiesterase class II)
MEDLIVQIASAVNMRSLYPAHHPHVVKAIDDAVSSLGTMLETRGSDSATILIIGDDLVIGEQVVRRTNLAQRNFTQMLKRSGIERVTLAAGIDAEEAHAFVSALAAGGTPQSSPHIILGHVHVGVDDADEGFHDHHAPVDEQIESVREAFGRFRAERKLPIAQMEQIVWSFIDSMGRNTRDVLPLAALKEHDEYTFVHSINVCLLVLAQARSFGIQGGMLHAMGMAALLHDVGKLMVPLTVLNKAGKLMDEEWELMKSHCEEGAWYLSGTEGVSPLSVVVAYEHHLRFDGEPCYPIPRTRRLPNLATRMTSIADAYDAMSTVRPYQQPRMRASAAEVLSSRAGTFYDPMLVGNFVRVVA